MSGPTSAEGSDDVVFVCWVCVFFVIPTFSSYSSPSFFKINFMYAPLSGPLTF